MELMEGERIDDLEYKGIKIIQNKNYFCFGIDSILLTDFAKEIKDNARCIDLGTGNGILAILLSAKTNLSEIYGIEVQEKLAELARRNVVLNNMEQKVEIRAENIKNLLNIFPKKSFDYVITNPPYTKCHYLLINYKIYLKSHLKMLLFHVLQLTFLYSHFLFQFHFLYMVDL